MLYVQQHYFLHAHCKISGDVLAAASLGTSLGSSSVADLISPRPNTTTLMCILPC